jgi:hypothetical protein
MSRHSRGVTLIATRSWVLIFSFAFIFSFFASHNTYALSVDPVLDDVFSLLNRNQSDNAQKPDASTNVKDKNDKTSDSTSTNAPLKTDPQVPGDGSATPEAPVIAEPLMELPSIDTSETIAQPIRSTQPAHAIPASPGAVLGIADNAVALPVQATSQGWKFFGVAWFWWFIAGATGYYISRRLIARYRRKLSRQKLIVS